VIPDSLVSPFVTAWMNVVGAKPVDSKYGVGHVQLRELLGGERDGIVLCPG